MPGNNAASPAPHSRLRNAVADPLEPDFKRCSALLLDLPTETRRPATATLAAMGFGRIDDTRDAQELKRAVAKGSYDLMIGDTHGASTEACDIIRQVRHNTVGRDPFLGIILTTAPAGPRGVRRAIDSGTDHLLVKPFSAFQIRARIRAIVDDRKPFVVTLDYVGPDRRDPLARGLSAARVEVPNALRAKARNDTAAIASPETIGEAMARINHHKISRYDHEIGVLTAMVVDSVERGEPTKRRTAKLKNLVFLADDLTKRVADTGFATAATHCLGLIKIVHDIGGATDSPTRKQLGTLDETSMLLHLAVNPGSTARQISSRIDASVAAIMARRAAAAV